MTEQEPNRINAILVGLQDKPMYQGTVKRHVVNRRRAANKRARQARKVGR